MTSEQTKAVIADAYWPLIRGYVLVALTYYTAMTTTHFYFMQGAELAAYASVSIITCLILAALFWRVRKRPTLLAINVASSIVNLLILVNILVALHVNYSEAKLVYFIMAAMVFALMSVSLVQALISITGALGGLAFELTLHASEQALIFTFVGTAAAFAAVGMSYYLRRGISSAATAEREASRAREKAEKMLRDEKLIGDILRRESLSDSLTGLPNRRAFFKSLGTQLEGAGDGWVALLDLDGFKAVNDTHGHLMGDELLKAVGDRLRARCGDNAHISRLGGDEFGIVIVSALSEAAITRWAEKLLWELAKTYPIDDRLIHVSGSIGCCPIGSEMNQNAAYQNADFALLRAKRAGKNRVVIFNDDHAEALAQRLQIEQALRSARLFDEIELVFQPQVDLAGETIVKAEVLARWEHQEYGKISPSRFIAVAEECGMVSQITDTVIDKTIQILRDLDDPIPLSVNLSGADLNTKEPIKALLARLDESGLDPALIEFEVTESAMLFDMEQARANLLVLAERGHAIAIDDFGTGYSNFNYLRSLPITKLKLDRSFIENPGDPMAEKVLRSMVGLADTLGVECLLEGVEDELGLLMAKRAGIQLVQGYRTGKPGGLDVLRQGDLNGYREASAA
ncbi:MAG: EAL domain-containing protein [Pseudomonadota bacterium]